MGFSTIDDYIQSMPEAVQDRLQAIRAAIKKAVPEAQETISYQMPTFTYYGNLLHFAAYAHHIGLYPTPSGVEAFKNELAPYKQGKGSVQFPLDREVPLVLIENIAKYRAEENLKRYVSKGKRCMIKTDETEQLHE